MINDKGSLKGIVTVLVHRGETGEVERHVFENLVANVGRTWMWDLATGTASPALMGYMALGTSSAAPTVNDTLLGAEITGARVATSNNGAVAGTVCTWTGVFGPGVATTGINEAGIFNASAINSGTMLAHVTFATITKGASDTVTIQWAITLS
jgi:hypothetical protein